MVGLQPLASAALVSLTSGGNIFVVDFNDSISAAESLVGLAVLNSSFTDTIVGSDGYAVPLLNKANFAPRPIIRDWWDRDEWGRFEPGGGSHNG